MVNAIYTAPAGSDVNLTSLTGSIGNLTPAFAPDTTSYMVGVDHEVASIDDTATLADENASMNIDGVPQTVTLNPAGTATVIDIVVTAEDGETEKIFSIKVNRAGAISILQHIYWENTVDGIRAVWYMDGLNLTFAPVFKHRRHSLADSSRDWCSRVRLKATAEG